mmetsp:Transcript_48974/g.116620  ORF Transcript_48974/g.116620 Transcript_48974/m.116620 type:complete len:173 (+) Transcript_48974:55-573(+)|eukprot:CAMPEP_0180143662 /NCGR_PEP_ID=MMETSP0986-20121125/16398_1 /TAXON_ID=697907 /ORGANISM="non described non described, Strain CCMP2293" /LENGTH=172 /DNA_ID=CAMNT_0022087271 /DNA_START=50 /DNA_END=568 /DNA_ORIENTATION=-
MSSVLATVFKALSLSVTYYAFSSAMDYIQPSVQNLLANVDDDMEVWFATIQHMVRGATSKPKSDAKPAKKAAVAPLKGGSAHASRDKGGHVQEVSATSEWDPHDLCALCNDSLQLIGELEAMSASMGNQYPGEMFAPCHKCEQRALSMTYLRASLGGKSVSWPASDESGWRS